MTSTRAPLEPYPGRRARRAGSLLATGILGLGLALVGAAGAAGRTLYWSGFEVEARLDAEGRLQVAEQQTMVFTGAWNGGERTFNVRPGQELAFHRVVRIDSVTGEEIDLVRGDLSRVDHYDFTSRDTLRWRSRMPQDPPFDDTALIYRLEYTLSGVLERRGDLYRLDHDFAFPDRFGTIERFVLDLELDPAWTAPPGFERRIELVDLPPGRSAVVTVDLDYAGSGRPAGALHSVAPWTRAAIVLAALAAMIWIFVRFRRFEVAQGRFDPLPAVEGREWLEEHVLGLRAEEAGAIWDQAISTPEVSALLARLVAEGKLASRVRREETRRRKEILELELLVDRTSFKDYERKLIDKLFFDGRKVTDTAEVRARYKSTGFNPASTITAGLLARLRKLTGFERPVKSASWRPTLSLLGAVLLCLLLEGILRGPLVLGPLIASLVVIGIWPLPFAYFLAYSYRRRSERPGLRLFWVLLPCYLLAAGVFLVCLLAGGTLPFARDLRVGIPGLLGLALYPLAILNSVLNLARTRDSREAVRIRQRLTAARDWFRRQLARPQPELEDAWLPYLLAFGLQREVDRWAVAHGDVERLHVPSSSATSSSGSWGGGWSGGGGAFGGAGATAAWGAAAAGLAAGVAAPSSGGSGGGGGGGGGGSSGGGGGGGW